MVNDSENIPEAFDTFWTIEKQTAIDNLSKEENLNVLKLQEVVSNYLFTLKMPLRDKIVSLMNTIPSLKERKSKAERVAEKILEFVNTFIEGMG